MEINKEDLKQIIDQIKLELDEWFKDNINLDDDFYWQMDSKECYRFAEEPNNFSLGQLTDDWTELLRLKTESEIPIKYDMYRLAAILKYLSESQKK